MLLAVAQILRKPDGGSRGFGFVTYKDEMSVEKCLVMQHSLSGKTVELKRAVKKEDMSGGGGMMGGMGGGGGGGGGYGMGGGAGMQQMRHPYYPRIKLHHPGLRTLQHLHTAVIWTQAPLHTFAPACLCCTSSCWNGLQLCCSKTWLPPASIGPVRHALLL